MQENLKVTSNIKKYQWLNIVETLSVFGAIGGSIASVVSQQIVFASIPLSLSLTLNLLNRKLLLNSIEHSNQTAIAQLLQHNSETQGQLGTLTEQIAQVQQQTTDLAHAQDHSNSAIAQIVQHNGETQAQLGTLTEQIAQVQQQTTDLAHAQDHSNSAIAQIVQHNGETQAQLGTLTEQIAQVQQQTTDLAHAQDHSNSAIAQIVQHNGETQAQLGTLTEQIAQVQQRNTDSSQDTSNLENYIQNLSKEQAEIAEIVNCLREIESCTQAIRISPNYANAYYNRGVNYQRLGDKQAAVGDYSEAICINPSYAEAYYARGILRAELGSKKGALEDLREAAKLFFEAGDIASYQTARNKGKDFHDLSSQPKTDASEEVAVECLFS